MMASVTPTRCSPQNIPSELKELPRWCVFQVLAGTNGKLKKTPWIPGVRPAHGARVYAACDDPATWRSFDEALADADVRGLYLGFAFDRDLGLTFIDLDHAIEPDEALTSEARLIVDPIESYTEVSVSGSGLHVVARGLPPDRFSLNGFAGRVEVYPKHGARFMLVTGAIRPGLGSRDGRIEERSAELARLFPARPDNGGHDTRTDAAHRATARLSDADEDAIVGWAVPFWTDGRRHHIALYLSGYLGKQGVPRDQAVRIIARCATDDADPGAKMHAAHTTYDALEAGEDVSGYHGLHDVCGLADDELARLKAVVRADGQAARTTDALTLPDVGSAYFEKRSPVNQEPERPWPVLDEAALYGLAGDVVGAIEPQTEGDPVAILINLLTMFGSALNRGPYAPVGATRHHANLFSVLVGATARGRKGTAYAEPHRLMALADKEWASKRIVRGLSSGEGLILQVRDPTTKTNKEGEEVLDDPGEPDKRLLVVEEEFASVLRMIEREGNSLSPIIRGAWDGTDLQTLTKHSPLRATGPHISILGHITQEELLRNLHAKERVNGFANRFMYLLVRRSKLLPDGGFLPDSDITALARRIGRALQEARTRGEMRRDLEAKRMWEAVYPVLERDRPGMLGAITARAAAQVLRLSLIYALLDGAMAIQRPHLEAALALWKYSEDSAASIFGDAMGDPVADTILRALRSSGAMTQTQLSDLFQRNRNAGQVQQALVLLLNLGKVRTWQGESVRGGRTPTWWEATS